MKFKELKGKLVNIEQICWINTRTDESGKVYCLYTFSKDLVIEKIYDNSDALNCDLRRLEIIDEQIHQENIYHSKNSIFARLVKYFDKPNKDKNI